MQSKQIKRQVVTNTLTGWLAIGCRMAIALVMVPFLLRNLGKDGYGLIGLMGVIVSFSTVADLGLRQALGRELSEKVAAGDVDGFRALSSTALALYLGIAAVLIAAGWALAPWFVAVFKVSEALRPDAIRLIRLYGSSSLLLSFVTPVITAGLQSFLRFDAVNMVQTFSGIASGILLFIFISTSALSPLVVWAAVMLSILVVNLLILWVFYRKWCFSGKLGFRYLNWREMAPLFRLGGYMYVLQMTNALAQQSDPLVVSYFFGTAGVALYQSGAKLSQMLAPAVLSLSTQIHPLTTRYHVLNQQEKQQKTLMLGTRYTLLMGVICSAGIIVFAERFCRLWLYAALGDDYATVAAVMRLWALANIFDYVGGMHWSVFLGMKKLPFVLAVQVPSSIFNILVSIYLVGFTGGGIPGVLAATIITGLARQPFCAWYVSKITGLSVRKYLLSAYLPPGILFFLLLAYHFAIREFGIHNWIGLAGSAALFGAYAALALLMVERRLIVEIWNQWRSR